MFDESASNPFRTFAHIPPDSRYRFMLERAQFTIMNFIKGPVCRGQVALNEINDHFWVFFVNPERCPAWMALRNFFANNERKARNARQQGEHLSSA